MLRLQRVFWSVYGRFVWDAQDAPRKLSQRQQIVDILKARRGMSAESVLDAGCGTGDYALALAQAGFRVTGIDYAVGMLARAQEKVTDEISDAVSFRQADLNTRLEFPDASFDHVINISVLQATSAPAFTLDELWRVLKPKGTLVLLHVSRPASHELSLWQQFKHQVRNLGVKNLGRIVLVTAKAWGERSGVVRYWTAAELRDALKASQFDVLSVDCGPPVVITAEKATLKGPVIAPSVKP